MIGHPPCTYLSYCGIRHFNAPGREEKRKAALDFFLSLFNSPIDKIALENPVGWINTIWRKPDQIVRPYYFGESEQKNICLWLKNLPKLTYGELLIQKPKPFKVYKGKNYYYTEKMGSGHKRSRFFTGIANAMADQWGNL